MRNILLMMLLFPVLASKSWASVAGEVNKANDLYRQGKFNDSLGLYQKALDQDDQSPIVKYDLGTDLYKKGEYDKALGYLSQAAQDRNLKIKPKAEYNLGNVLYKSGIQKENTNVDQAIKNLREALGYYGQTIAVDPKDQDALYNQEFVKKEIERLKQKKQQQQQQQQNQQQNQKQQQQDQQNQQSQQNKQEDQQSQQSSAQDQEKKKTQEAQDQKEQQQQKKVDQQKVNQQSAEQQKQNAQEQAQQNQKALDRKAAEDLLEDYRENEEPKKLLNYMPKKIDDSPVLKDW